MFDYLDMNIISENSIKILGQYYSKSVIILS